MPKLSLVVFYRPQVIVFAQTPAVGAEYLVYAPAGGEFTVDLSAMPASRSLAVEWFSPATGTAIAGNPVAAGSTAQAFTPPFSDDAVLYLVDASGHRSKDKRWL